MFFVKVMDLSPERPYVSVTRDIGGRCNVTIHTACGDVTASMFDERERIHQYASYTGMAEILNHVTHTPEALVYVRITSKEMRSFHVATFDKALTWMAQTAPDIYGFRVRRGHGRRVGRVTLEYDDGAAASKTILVCCETVGNLHLLKLKRQPTLAAFCGQFHPDMPLDGVSYQMAEVDNCMATKLHVYGPGGFEAYVRAWVEGFNTDWVRCALAPVKDSWARGILAEVQAAHVGVTADSVKGPPPSPE